MSGRRARRGRRPVMVWFHGGGQRTGSGNSIFYDGTELARKHDVVVVTVTHRLNALGYLWLAGLPGTGERFADSANLGLLDLVLALEWVRDNVARVRRRSGQRHDLRAVGRRRKDGDADGIPAAKGLFHRAIIMSTLADTAITGLEPERAVEAAELLLAAARTSRQRRRRGSLSMPPEQIVDALRRPAAEPAGADLSLRYVPVVDGKTLPAHPFEPARRRSRRQSRC